MEPTLVQQDAPIEAVLPRIPLFSRVRHEQLRALAAAAEVVRVESGQTVVRQGAPGDSLYSILSGALRVIKEADASVEVELRRLGPGDSFGELAILDGEPRAATVQALEPSRLVRLSRSAFLASISDSPELLADVLANVVHYARDNAEQVLRQELEQRALRAEMELEKHRALSRMVAGVAHEINTPLGVVNTAASIITRRLDSGEDLDDVREAARLIHANIQRAHKLIRDFKQLSVSQIADTRETLSLPEVVDDVIGLFRIAGRSANLDVRVLDQLPDQAAGTWIGYRGYLTQVLLNLLTNAERYAYPEGAGGRIDVILAEACHREEEDFVITVRDFGRGIPADAVGRVFEPFYTTGRGKGGTGLGLAIVRNVVTSGLKGNVELSTQPDEGTAVSVTFPKRITE